MNERPLRVAMILADERDVLGTYARPQPYFGMAPAALLEGLRGLPGLELHIVTCMRENVPPTPKLAENVYFHMVRISRFGFLRTFYLESIKKAREIIRRIDPDLVHGQGTERYQALIAAFSGRPNVITIHGNMRAITREIGYPLFSFHWFTARLESVALWKTDGVLCNSAYTRNQVKSLAARTWDVPNALYSGFFSRSTESRDEVPVILNIGHIWPRKCQVELLEAARRLFLEGLRFRIDFIGGLTLNNEYSRRFDRLVTAAAHEGWARFVGLLDKDEVVGRMARARGFIHVPREEAFGLVVAESISQGLKSFLFREGGVADIAAGVPGVELFPQNDWSGLMNAVAGWLRAGAPPSDAGRDLMRDRYSPASVARQHMVVYRELLASPRRQSPG